jgi:hypothetical protein
VVGEGLNFSDLYSALLDAGIKLQRELHPVFLTRSDWRRKAADKNSFVSRLMLQPKNFVFGSEKDLQDMK